MLIFICLVFLLRNQNKKKLIFLLFSIPIEINYIVLIIINTHIVFENYSQRVLGPSLEIILWSQFWILPSSKDLLPFPMEIH